MNTHNTTKKLSRQDYCKKRYQENKERLLAYNKAYRMRNSEYLSKREKQYYLLNKEQISEKRQHYYVKNKEDIKEYQKARYQKEKEKIARYQKEYKKQNTERIALRNKEYYLQNRERISLHNKGWYERNKRRIKERVSIYNKANRRKINENCRWKYKNDTQFKLRNILSNRILNAIKQTGGHKNLKTVELLGGSVEEVRNYIESQFTKGMSWGNHGLSGWHIDHIIPCNTFDLTDVEQQKLCFHYTNLRPLWGKENQSRPYDGSDVKPK